ncbi:MAG TPA: DUF1080 domain-containing protein [Verrucomicrobiales bacterium]|nr:DUF1080 domain-containing protein [Verrucomicrobiales bacterium]
MKRVTFQAVISRVLWIPLTLLTVVIVIGDDSGFTSIFDGKTLAGWNGDPDHWRVEDGVITGEIPSGQTLRRNTWLVWEGGKLEDFELRFQFKLSGKAAANSGVQIRCQVENINHVSGYQADLDMGATWLGRIYDEHGRALLVERGTRVQIDKTGKRTVEKFADATVYKVLFRENEWNDYRVIASGEHISVEINGTLFSELIDSQEGEKDLSGSLAFQLHSGPETKVQFRKIQQRKIEPGSHRVEFKKTQIKPKPSASVPGEFPKDEQGRSLNFGFENGTLEDWIVEGKAFEDQPVKEDGISTRWSDQVSAKQGKFFIGGYEKLQDAPQGRLHSVPFRITQPFAGFLISGGDASKTRLELVQQSAPQAVIFQAGGADREQMVRKVIDLREHQGKVVFIRLVDEHSSAWGHLNFDDFRFYHEPPLVESSMTGPRMETNPILSHLVDNPVDTESNGKGFETLRSMQVQPGFAVDLIAAEPDVFQPIAFTFDERGRIWVAEAHSYPKKRQEGEGLDRILIFEDSDHDGHYENRKVFTTGLNLVSGLEVGFGGVWIGAAPQLLFIPDRNRDDQPDGEPVVLLEGFGYQDTHETLNSFLWGPDGWLYGNQGVFNYSQIGKPGAAPDEKSELRAGVWRYHPTRHEFEVFAHGGSNQWGLDYDQHGQIFITHCRSFWGKGSTTHVIKGGQYWNQANRNYADYVSRNDLPGYPFFRNFLPASSRYGHGEGGAGKPGTRRVYGGHSQVGTMIYLGDNWPDEFRGRLFSHNLHGHQLNQQINLREGSAYNTVHAGQDVLYSPDPRYVTVGLKYGPDGAVYMTDWYDTQHCHNPNTEQWDRSNGRIYRMRYVDSFRPARVNLADSADMGLVRLQSHKNSWQARTARRLLQERSASGRISSVAVDEMNHRLRESASPIERLRSLWSLHLINELTESMTLVSLNDPDEYVRAWSIQLISSNSESFPGLDEKLVSMAKQDTSQLVRLYLASALQALPPNTSWRIAEHLCQHEEDASDRYLPRMLWYGLAGLMKGDPERGYYIADSSSLPVLKHYARWYTAKSGSAGLDRVIGEMILKDDKRDHLEAMRLAVLTERNLPMPPLWSVASSSLYNHPNARIRFLSEQIGSVFGDRKLFPDMRSNLGDSSADPSERRHAFAILSNARDKDSVPLFLSLLDHPEFRADVIQLASKFDDPDFTAALIHRMEDFDRRDQGAAMNVLSQRKASAKLLLKGMEDKTVNRSHLTAFYVRQLNTLNDPQIDQVLERIWGKAVKTSEEQEQQINQLNETFSEAPLWAYNAREGRKHFELLCMNCHQVKGQGVRIGPDLTGSGSNGSRYFIENIIDPNAVIGLDYQMSIIETKDDEIMSGIIEEKTDSSVTIRTLTDRVVVTQSEIESLDTSEQSMMPSGLLDTLNDREIVELLKFLRSI